MNLPRVALAVGLLLAFSACTKDAPPAPAPAPSPSPASPTPADATAPAATAGTGAPQMPALVLPDDPKRKEKVALGHALFFDKRLSVDNSRACYSCHMNENGNGGADPVAIGAGDKKLTRHSPVMWNVAYFKNALAWEGRIPSLEAQAKAAVGSANMGVGTEPEKLQKKVDELAAIAGYTAMFEAAFPGQKPTIDAVAQAIAEYERTLICNDTAYDKFAAGDANALDASQKRGWDVFMGAAGCAACHTPPLFTLAAMTDGGVYYNVGIGTQKPEAEVDIGRKKITNLDTDWAAFKIPTLRNVSKSAPYFHDGSVAKLEDAVKLMANGGIDNKHKTPVLTARTLTPEQLADLVAFLGALDCGKLVEPKLP